MYPSLVDMDENESSKYLRMLELDAYANILAALRAQGPPTSDKLKLLRDIGTALRIPHERFKAEIRKVILDERLNTIAYFSCGQLETSDEWIKEGRRLISLMPRVPPQTIYSSTADEVADSANISNEQLPLPANTERKRPAMLQALYTSETTKSQQFKVPDVYKVEENKKRKLTFGVENSSLAQHLTASSTISRIQQLYRQKVKTPLQEELLKSKIKQESDHDYRHVGQSRVLQQQQQFQAKPQKVSLSSANVSPRLNILQNISIPPLSRGEETIEQIKNEVNNIVVQKATEQGQTSPTPSCSNENQAPKQQKHTVVNIKPNTNMTYRHIASPGPTSEFQKSLKVCSTRKQITKAIPGQKLIIVSNAQSIATSSILQRSLTIPFVKNIAVKNFDKFKIVTTSTNSSGMQLYSIANSNANMLTTSSTKHKVVTVRTNSNSKKMIPLAHLHALNAKGSIKMLPVGGKIITKATNASVSSPLYIMNNSRRIQQAPTKTISSTPVMMTSRLQEPVSNELKSYSDLESDNMDIESSTPEIIHNDNDISPTELSDSITEISKSSVLADILKASGVISSENEQVSDDIESQITQLTAIPHTVPDRIMADVQDSFDEIETEKIINYNDEVQSNPNPNSTYIILDKSQNTDELLKELGDDSSSIVIRSLDPATGECTVKTINTGNRDNSEYCEENTMVDVQH